MSAVTLLLAFIMLQVFPCVHPKSTQVGVNNNVDGDQSVGGVHLFEMHTPEGGMGLGIKFIIVGVIVGIICYWCVSRRLKKCKQAVRPYAAAAQYLPQLPQLPHYAPTMAPVHPQPPVAPAPRARRLSDPVFEYSGSRA